MKNRKDMASYYEDPTITVRFKEDHSREFGIPLVYPNDLSLNGESKAISFFAVKYKKDRIGRQEKTSEVLSRIYLPVPPELNSGDAQNYEEFSAPFLQNMVQSIQDAWNGNLRSAAANATSTVAVMVDRAFGQDAKYGQSQMGQTVNPRNTNLFKAPKAREYQFSYKLIANNQNESKTINEIIKRFRYHSYPNVNIGEGIFQVPDIFLINIKRYDSQSLGWEDNDYMFKPLPCALIAMNVQYNGDAPVAFYKGTGAPVEVTLTLNFVEMELDNKKQLAERYYGNSPVINSFTDSKPDPVENTPNRYTEAPTPVKQSATAGRYDTTNTFPRVDSGLPPWFKP